MQPQTMPAELSRWTADQLSSLGYRHDFKPEALLVEASHRYFYRIHARGGEGDERSNRPSFVMMRSPPDKENNEQFVRLAKVFADHGIGVPEIIATAPDVGYFLLSDLGGQHFRDAYESPDRDPALAAGINTLIDIQSIDHPAVPKYQAQRFRDELQIFREWFVEGWLAEDFPVIELDDVFEQLVINTQNQPQCCVHRDFHCRNLLYSSDDGRVGVVDFQDALVGPVSYDLASLLRDCYFQFSESQIARWRDYYLQHTPFNLEHDAFAMQLDLTAVQRQLKAVGIFARLQLRDEKPSHLSYIAGVLSQLQALAGGYAVLAPLRAHLVRWRHNAESRLGSDA
ncbi:MAG: phosphotransferase [Pseudomonadales bacterium]